MSLNFQQRQIFNEVQDWIKKKIKARKVTKFSLDPLRLFITGLAGVGKSHLMTTICIFIYIFIYLFLTICTFKLYSGSPDKPKVRVLAPTGVATININGTTINSGLSMPLDVNGYIFRRLSDYE